MCGIVGYINKEETDANVLRAMMDKIIHRGPDGSGIYFDENIALGHRRLSIIDLEHGSQPMKNEDETMICIFNGEIYNFQEVKNELMQRGHIFRTESDTEVLVHGYEQWKQDLPRKLRGMFAFAIWDSQKKELFCARDYFGIKPFYYYKNGETFLFGSEIKSFLPHPKFEKVFNEEQLELYLTYQYSPGETTFFESVYKLLPAHYLLWKNGEIEIQRYWMPSFKPDDGKTMTEWEWEIHEVMHDSVNAHKLSDVEIGTFLSSGVDSSYVTEISGVHKTFTVGFENEKYNESVCASDFSKSLGCQNTTYQIKAKEFWEKLPSIQYYMDEPLADASAVALYFLNREAAKQVKVCLSGEGADELFGGYNIYKEPFMCKRYDDLPLFVRKVIGMGAAIFPSVRGVNFLVRHSKPLSERYIGNTSLFTERQKRKLMRNFSGKIKASDISKPYFNFQANADDVTRMQYTDLHLWLAGDILLKADKMSMANSLELRVPFLDREVFETARKIPTKYRVDEKQTKIALRRAASLRISEESAERKKWGFPVPVREWLREEQYVAIVKNVFEGSSAKKFFHIKMLNRLLEEHARGKRDHWRQIWCVYMFLLWYEEFFG